MDRGTESSSSSSDDDRPGPLPESYVPPPLLHHHRSGAASGKKHSRAISTVAQSFADDLDSVFGLSAGIATLSQTVEEKKASVSHGQSELEQLEVRLRATEERLAKVSRNNSPSRQADAGAGDASNQQQEPPQQHASSEKQSPSPLAKQPTYPADRPPTAPRRDAPPAPPSRGNAPAETQGHTPGREDYVMVDRTGRE